jgi:hypothetical protein
MSRCSKCRKQVIVTAKNEVRDIKTGEPHRCADDVYDLPEKKRVPWFIPKTDRFKSPKAN